MLCDVAVLNAALSRSLVVLPTYNERENIEPIVAAILGQAEDLAPMALAVLSNRVSAYVTGSAIVVDGGLSLTNWFEPPELDDL